MDIQLITGTFTKAEATELLTAIFKVKIAFHEQKIETTADSEENIKHAEKRIMQLQQALRDAIQAIRETSGTHTTLNAQIEVH